MPLSFLSRHQIEYMIMCILGVTFKEYDISIILSVS